MCKQLPEHFWKKLSRLVGPRQANHWMEILKKRRAPPSARVHVAARDVQLGKRVSTAK